MTTATGEKPTSTEPLSTSAIITVQRKKSKKRGRTGMIVGIQIALVLALLGIWELVSGTLVPEILLSRPSKVLPLFWQWIIDGTLLTNAASTFSGALWGLLIGGLAGIIVGAILGQSKILADIFEPFITALYTMPKHALIPLFIMWVGIGSMLGIVTSAVIVFFLVFFNTFFGMKDVRQSLIDSVRIMGGSPWDVMFRVRLPSALIWVVAALKLAVPQAVVGVVVAEMLAGDSGLGYLVAHNAGMFNSAGTFSALIALLIAGYLIDRLMTWVTKKPLAWKNNNSTS
ncbi:ABC transporter permease [Gulosibacter chungangensis]|uniref:ABC transporter permease n=1 Tax=Gulosibacter chungangensis TaxID=979746 RepID=A0A7J5BI30_9MICO|nr:ABC transporter permease [Gulosibacter chungangensis]KAB1645099.1 ABC transporter permease [Gulosibacter chungangensis]